MACLICGQEPVRVCEYMDANGILHVVEPEHALGQICATCALGLDKYRSQERLVLIGRAKGECPWCRGKPYHYGTCPAVNRLRTGESAVAVILRDASFVTQIAREIKDGRITLERATRHTRGRWTFEKRGEDIVAFYEQVSPPVEDVTYVPSITLRGWDVLIGGYVLFPKGRCGACGFETETVPCPLCGAA